MSSFLDFYKKSKPIAPLQSDEASQLKYYKKLRFSTFMAATIGYSLYYVCRTGLNVVKEPILQSGALSATQLGVIGSVLLFSYAIGKFFNGFLADHSNITRFMATGLIVSTIANFLVGITGIGESAGLFSPVLFFISFSIMWGVNGWSQSMGAAPAIISLSRWYPLRDRGTYYGFFSSSHNLGEFLSFLFVGSVVGTFGWQWGFFGSSFAGLLGVMLILYFLHDNTQSKGLPPIEVLSREPVQAQKRNQSGKELFNAQLNVLRNPAVWVLALSSAFMYVSRYAINSWGVLFLQKEKGFDIKTATLIISINALLGILGTVLSGWFSDKLFKGKRNMPALIFGVLNAISIAMFVYCGDSFVMNVISMVLFGIAIGVLICFLGGLMAVDIVPRSSTGAALGVVGVFSYIGAGLQDVISGTLIDSHKTILPSGEILYNFEAAGLFWIAASVISFSLALLVWNAKPQRD